MNDSMRDRPLQAYSSYGLPVTASGYTAVPRPSTGRSPVQHHQETPQSMASGSKYGPSPSSSVIPHRSSLEVGHSPFLSTRTNYERLPSLKEILATSRTGERSDPAANARRTSSAKSPQFRMSFSPVTDSRPVEPAEPDPFTSRPYPITGTVLGRPPVPFPGPLQLPAGSHPPGSATYLSPAIAPNAGAYQPSHIAQPKLRHDSFLAARGSVSQAEDRRLQASFASTHETYCSSIGQRHDSAAGIEARPHSHVSNVGDRYMLAESSASVLQYGPNHHERESSAYTAASGSGNEIQGATIMGYGSGGLVYIRKRRGNLPKEATNFLKKWFDEHMHNPYPTEEDKQWMVRKTGLEANQISNWFINARRRRKHNRSPEHSYHERMSPSSEPPSPTASGGMDTPLQSPARPPPGYQ